MRLLTDYLHVEQAAIDWRVTDDRWPRACVCVCVNIGASLCLCIIHTVALMKHNLFIFYI